VISSDPPDHAETNAAPSNTLASDIEEQLHELSHTVRGPREPIVGRRPGESRLDAYDRISRLPVFMFGMFILVGLVLKFGNQFDTHEGNTIVVIGWVGFILDLLIRWALDENPLTFPKRHWLIFLAVALPPLRLVLIGYVVAKMARSPRLLRNRLSVYSLYLTILVITFGAVIVLAFEKQSPNANIKNYGQALWWAVCTIATVGYGDYTPVTTGGRIAATLVILTGLATISIVTATIASRFVTGPSTAQQTELEAVSLEDIEERLVRIETALAALATAKVGDRNATETGEIPEEIKRDDT
jgi:voltage-gated potassium channel